MPAPSPHPEGSAGGDWNLRCSRAIVRAGSLKGGDQGLQERFPEGALRAPKGILNYPFGPFSSSPH